MRLRQNSLTNAADEDKQISDTEDQMIPENTEIQEDTENEDSETEEKSQTLPERVEAFTQRDGMEDKSTVTFKEAMGGDILTGKIILKYWKIIGLCFFYIIIYITNRYQAQQELIEIADLKVELQKQKYYALTRSSELTIRSRQSQIEELLQDTPDSLLIAPKNPPFIIKNKEEDS